jgi:hypothetical protein
VGRGFEGLRVGLDMVQTLWEYVYKGSSANFMPSFLLLNMTRKVAAEAHVLVALLSNMRRRLLCLPFSP